MHLAALVLVAALTCEDSWTPGCETLTYDGIEAAACISYHGDGICAAWVLTPYGDEINRKRAEALPDCSAGMDFAMSPKGHPCKVPRKEIELVPVPGGNRAD